MQSVLVCEALHKTYPGRPPVEALRGVDLLVSAGECFGVLGPNGAGKTTLIEILEGVQRASSGDVSLFGLGWRGEAQQIRERIGITLQDTHFSDKLTVREIVALFRSFYSTGLEPDDAIARVSLQEKADARVETLSGGQKQRLAVATSLVGNPDLLFLDEPTTGLDPTSRRELWEVIRRFREQGRTTVLTTHYLEEAERLCDRVAIIDHGRIIAIGSPQELIGRMGGQHVIEFSIGPGGDEVRLLGLLRELPGVSMVATVAGHLRVSTPELHHLAPELFGLLQREGLSLATLSTRQTSLEDVFVEMTGRSFEESDA